MVRVKPIEEAKANYASGATVAPARYESAVKRVTNWQEQTTASGGLWAEQVRRAISKGSFRKGVAKVSNAEWQSAAVEKGVPRIGFGMSQSVDIYAREWAPFRAAIEAVTLPPRTADPMRNVDQRVKPIVDALVKAKEAAT